VATARALRSPFTVTLQVWRALLLREAVARIARAPMAWFWMIAVPVSHIAFLVFLYVVGFRHKVIVGADASVFIMVGVMGFFLPRNIFNLGVAAVPRAQALYSYRQIKPIDIVIARIWLQTLLWCVVCSVVFTGAVMLGVPVRLADPLSALAALGCLWLSGVGLTLVFSVLAGLSRQFGNLLRMLMRPLYILSGVMFSTMTVPLQIRDAILLNPLVHGLETLRVAFMPAYQIPASISLVYLAQFAVILIFLGLLLHARFRDRLRALK